MREYACCIFLVVLIISLGVFVVEFVRDFDKVETQITATCRSYCLNKKNPDKCVRVCRNSHSSDDLLKEEDNDFDL